MKVLASLCLAGVAAACKLEQVLAATTDVIYVNTAEDDNNDDQDRTVLELNLTLEDDHVTLDYENIWGDVAWS